MKRVVVVLLFLFLLVPQFAEAQCAMCRAVLQTEEAGDTAKGINNGIVYLMAIPYLLVGGLFFFIYRKMRT